MANPVSSKKTGNLKTIYEALPQTPYAFTFWQYSNTGKVNGVEGDSDQNIWMRKKKE